MDEQRKQDNLKLIDSNINLKGMELLVCDSCESKLLYQKGYPAPLCPTCYQQGSTHKLRKFFMMGGK